MKKIFKEKPSLSIQYKSSFLLVLIVAFVAFLTQKVVGYIGTALMLLVVVSLLAITFEIMPVLLAAILSALVLNFFFIPPLYTFHIDNSEDILLFLMFIVIALINAVLTNRIRKVEKIARDKEEKENSIRLYNTLLNSLSHELRTPISTILGAVDIIKENREKLSVKQRDELLTEIGTASIRLNHQVDNLLNMNRLETGMLKLKLDWCDINELIYSVIQKLDLTAKKNNLKFKDNDQLPLVKLDSGLMEHVFYNILNNAILYTPEYSTISIEVSYDNDMLRIVISDDGNGFPASEIPFLFEKFYRLPHTKTGGSGLGLSISKGYIEAHNGTIVAENNIPTGAKFTMNIPVESSFINNLKNE